MALTVAITHLEEGVVTATIAVRCPADGRAVGTVPNCDAAHRDAQVLRQQAVVTERMPGLASEPFGYPYPAASATG